MVWVKEKTHQRLCSTRTPAFPFPNCGTLSILLVRDSLHICFWLFLLTLIQQCPIFHIPIYMACSVHRGWLLTAHRDKRHAWNTQLVLADGKNKGLHFPKNNVVEGGRKETTRRWRWFLELKCWASCYLTASVSASSSCLPPKESEPGLQVRGSLLFFFFKNKCKYNCVCVYSMYTVMAKLFPVRKSLKIAKGENECFLSPMGIFWTGEPHLEGLGSRAGEPMWTTQCRNRAIHNIADGNTKWRSINFFVHHKSVSSEKLETESELEQTLW